MYVTSQIARRDREEVFSSRAYKRARTRNETYTPAARAFCLCVLEARALVSERMRMAAPVRKPTVASSYRINLVSSRARECARDSRSVRFRTTASLARRESLTACSSRARAHTNTRTHTRERCVKIRGGYARKSSGKTESLARLCPTLKHSFPLARVRPRGVLQNCRYLSNGQVYPLARARIFFIFPSQCKLDMLSKRTKATKNFGTVRNELLGSRVTQATKFCFLENISKQI